MKRVFALILALVTVMSCMVALPLVTSAATTLTTTDTGWNGSATKPVGQGRKENPYLIDSAGDLLWLANNPGGGAQYFQSMGYNGSVWQATYTEYNSSGAKTVDMWSFLEAPYIYCKQVCDIDMNGKNIATIGAYWSMQGQGGTDVKGQFFHGEYDGQGFTIKNGSFARSNTNFRWTSAMFGNLFGATVKNIVFENIQATPNAAAGNSAILAANCVGPEDFAKNGYLYGNNSAKIPSAAWAVCSAMGQNVIENIIVKDTCTANGTNGSGSSLGGLVAEADYATIRNCLVDATIENTMFTGAIQYAGDTLSNGDTHVGGIVGHWGPIYNLPAVVKESKGLGAQGMGDCAILHCYNFGSFGGFTSKPSQANFCLGGIVGCAADLYDAGTDATYRFRGNVHVGDNWDVSKAVAGSNPGIASVIGRVYNSSGWSYEDVYYVTGGQYDTIVEDEIVTLVRPLVIKDSFGHSVTPTSPNWYDHNQIFTSRIYGATQADNSASLLTVPAGILDSDENPNDPNPSKQLGANGTWSTAGVQKVIDAISALRLTGSGTETDPYIVDEPADLEWMAWASGNGKVASGEGLYQAFNDKYFVQVCDIDFEGATLQPIGTSYNETATGVAAGTAFAGHYDGQGYAIKNVKIESNPGVTGGYIATGTAIFGAIYGATIKNVNAKNVDVTGVADGLAVIVGVAQAPHVATVDGVTGFANTHATFNIINNCTVDADCSVTWPSNKACGGYATSGVASIAGAIYSTTVTDCYNMSDVNVYQSVGGGGIVGTLMANNRVEDCVTMGDINFDATTYVNTWENNIGGLIGGIVYDKLNTKAPYTVLVKDCIALGDINYKDNSAKQFNCKIGGLVGDASEIPFGSSVTVEGCYAMGNLEKSSDWTHAGQFRYGALLGCAFIGSALIGQAGTPIVFVDCSSMFDPDQTTTNSGGYSQLGMGAAIEMNGEPHPYYQTLVRLVANSGQGLYAGRYDRTYTVDGVSGIAPASFVNSENTAPLFADATADQWNYMMEDSLDLLRLAIRNDEVFVYSADLSVGTDVDLIVTSVLEIAEEEIASIAYNVTMLSASATAPVTTTVVDEEVALLAAVGNGNGGIIRTPYGVEGLHTLAIEGLTESAWITVEVVVTTVDGVQLTAPLTVAVVNINDAGAYVYTSLESL